MTWPALRLGAAEIALPVEIESGVALWWHLVLACLAMSLPVAIYALGSGDDSEVRSNGLDAPADHANPSAIAAGLMAATTVGAATVLAIEMIARWRGFAGGFNDLLWPAFSVGALMFGAQAIFVLGFGLGLRSPLANWRGITMIPVTLFGAIGAFLVAALRAWKANPVGFTAGDGCPSGDTACDESFAISDPDPFGAMLNIGALWWFGALCAAGLLVVVAASRFGQRSRADLTA